MLAEWQVLEAQQYAHGDVDYDSFKNAVHGLQFIIERASAAIYTFLNNEITSRFTALDNVVNHPNFGIDRTQPFGVRAMIHAAPDIYYPLQQLSWLLRDLDIECVMNYEMLIGGTATPLQSWTTTTQTIDISDIPATYSAIIPAAFGGMQRDTFLNAMCSMPTECNATLSELMTVLEATVLAVTVPLRNYVLVEANSVWAAQGLTQDRAVLCIHYPCCNGTGLLFSPPSPPPPSPPLPLTPPSTPPLPPYAPGALTPPPFSPPPPSTPEFAPGCCACEAEPPFAPPTSPAVLPPPADHSPPPADHSSPPSSSPLPGGGMSGGGMSGVPPPPAPCGGTGLRGRTCSQCAEDRGCAALVSAEARCEAGFSAAAWAEGEAHKGLACQSSDNSVQVDVSCHIDGGVDGWHDGRASGNCTAKALYGSNTYVGCAIPGCTFAVGEKKGSCSNITCAQDLSVPGTEPDEAAQSFAAGLTGKLAVDCHTNDAERQSLICDVSIGGIVLPGECTVSRCISVAAPPTIPYSEVRDVPAECAERLADGFGALAVGVAGVAIGLILLVVGACSGSTLTPPQRRQTVEVVKKPPPPPSPPRTPPPSPPAIESPSSSTTIVTCDIDLIDPPDELGARVRTLMPLKQPPTLQWADLSVSAEPTVCGLRCGSATEIVHPISGALSGGCTALMGPSGSGKTTMLHAVTGLPHAGMKRSGAVTLDGTDVNKLPHGVISLVPQDAVLAEELTAREALHFACALGLRGVRKAERLALVEAILQRLGIASVADQTIGGRLAGRSGLSGGERKRVSVGVALATCPHALLLDEPSSGLDAYSAIELCRMLKTLAHDANRTVLVSVHQPSTQLFQLFDGLILLGKGHCVYDGPPLSAVAHLVSEYRAKEPRAGVAPADYLLEILVTDEERFKRPADPSKATKTSRPASVRATSDIAPDASSGRAAAGGLLWAPCAIVTEVSWLGWRCVAQLARDPALLVTQLLLHLGVAIFMGGVFFQVDSDIAGFQNKAGSISFLLYFFALGGLSTAQSVTREWPLLWAEYHQGLYGAVTYTVTRLLIELTLLRVLPATAFSGIFYAMMGLRREIAPFLRFLLASSLASAASALICAATAAVAPRHPGATSLVATVELLACLLVAGFNLNLTALPDWIEWLAWLSFGRHAFEIMLCSELDGQMIVIDQPGVPRVSVQSSIILGAMGLDPNRYDEAFAALFAFCAIAVVVTALIVCLQMRPSCRRPVRAAAHAHRASPSSLANSEIGMPVTPMPRKALGAGSPKPFGVGDDVAGVSAPTSKGDSFRVVDSPRSGASNGSQPIDYPSTTRLNRTPSTQSEGSGRISGGL